MWAKWEPGFDNGTLMTTTAVDTRYEITARFRIGEGSRAGLYLFYDEQAYIGLQGNDSKLAIADIALQQPRMNVRYPVNAGSNLYVRIRNDRNKVTVWRSTDGNNWSEVCKDVDVSTYHHNVYKGFFALRPAYFLDGGATLESFDYKPL